MHTLSYLLTQSLLIPLSFLSFKGLYKLSRPLAFICYPLLTKYRKRALSNLKLASELKLSDVEIIDLSKKSLFHLLLTALEYGKLSRMKRFKEVITTLNAQTTNRLLDKKKGVIFLCGHQSNWELLFLDATSRHPGVCIGKPIKNKKLYQFILSIREKFQGQVITPKNGYKGCMQALKKGHLVGIVGDQGMPDSPFSYTCMGRKATATTLPALLSLRSGCPLVVATIIRHYGFYSISYSDPIETFPNDPDPIRTLTLKSLTLLDEKIKKNPEQWMWQHNRWKIQYPHFIPKKYRHDALCVVVPDNNPTFLDELELLKQTYKDAYIIALIPSLLKIKPCVSELITYSTLSDCFIPHFGPKLILDGVGIKGLKRHFKKLAAFEYIYTPSLKQLIHTWKDHAH